MFSRRNVKTILGKRKRRKYIQGIKFCSEKYFLYEAAFPRSYVCRWVSDSQKRLNRCYIFKKGGDKVIKYDILVCNSCHVIIVVLSCDDHHVIIWWSSYQLNRKHPTHAIFSCPPEKRGCPKKHLQMVFSSQGDIQGRIS